MWISKQQYTDLVDARARAETKSDWLLTQVNLLNAQLGEMKYQQTGKPTPVPLFQREATPQDTQTPIDVFDDMGDVAARIDGVDWDDAGRVKFAAPADTK